MAKRSLIPPSPPKEKEPDNVPELAFVKQIDSGTYGTVYQGKYKGEDCAIKILKPDSTIDKDIFQSEFVREVCMLTAISNPYCLKILAASPSEPWVIVTEFCHKGALHDVVHNKRESLTFKQKVDWALEIALGMQYLHSLSPPLVHRDLKLLNILITQSGHIKICDFGFARFQEATLKTFCGTAMHMAPEITAMQGYSLPADVYAFGILCHELASRETPFRGLTDRQILEAVLNNNLRPRSLIVGVDCPEGFDQLVSECWDTLPERRPNFNRVVERLQDISTALSLQKLALN